MDSQRSPLTQYVIVRKDLPLGVVAAQVAHAAGSYQHPPGTFVVVLAAESEVHIRKLMHRLEAADIEHTVVEECDAPYDGQIMAIGLGLVHDRRPVRKVVSNLPLLR